jgi:hypothetical protein
VADAPRFDPRRLRPGELCRILNSTPLGEVTSERAMVRRRFSPPLRVMASAAVLVPQAKASVPIPRRVAPLLTVIFPL